MAYERFLNPSQIPDDAMIETALGTAKPLWFDVREYLRTHYDFTPEFVFFTKKYGWTVRYRKGKKTLCCLFPETGAFSILMVLGKEEAARAEQVKNGLNETVRYVLETTEQLHDGRWLWIKALDESDVRSFLLLLAAKKKPTGNAL